MMMMCSVLPRLALYSQLIFQLLFAATKITLAMMTHLCLPQNVVLTRTFLDAGIIEMISSSSSSSFIFSLIKNSSLLFYLCFNDKVLIAIANTFYTTPIIHLTE
jgi:hypothetical protein